MTIDIKKIKVGDNLICLAIKDGKIVPIEHVVTRIENLDMYGIRTDINKEVMILGSSILEHRPRIHQ